MYIANAYPISSDDKLLAVQVLDGWHALHIVQCLHNLHMSNMYALQLYHMYYLASYTYVN